MMWPALSVDIACVGHDEMHNPHEQHESVLIGATGCLGFISL